MKGTTKHFLAVLFFLICHTLFAQTKAGIGRKVITPKNPVWLNGYANPGRFKPATGVDHDLWAKALVIESSGGRVVIVTTDILGFTHEISVDIAKRLKDKYGIARSQLVLNSSHTHSGPMIWPAAGMFDYDTENMKIVYEYTKELTDNVVAAVDMAMASLAPMKISTGHGTGTFAMNRRDPKITTRPVDQDVPVLKIETPTGEVKAILFGYACHNTTLSGEQQQVNGDYAGYAQIELEKAYPGATALFFMGCGGDINPTPRGTLENAQQHGRSLAQSVESVIGARLKPVDGTIHTAYSTVDLEFRPFDLSKYQHDMLSNDQYVQRRAKLMLQAYNKGWDISKYAYPVQAIRIGDNFTFLALSGEIVVDYSLWAKKEFAGENLFVAGYSNEVMCYIPTKRILGEGGYEPDDSMIYYVLPGPFADDVEERIHSRIKEVMKEVGSKAR